MKGDIVFSVFLNMAGYFALVFVGTWIVGKIFTPLDAIPLCLIHGQYLKALFLAFLTYAIYFVAALFIAGASTDGSGKFVVFVIGAFLLWNLIGDIREITDNFDKISLVFACLIFMMKDVVQIIATFHGFAEGSK